jgi:hypothetical protein
LRAAVAGSLPGLFLLFVKIQMMPGRDLNVSPMVLVTASRKSVSASALALLRAGASGASQPATWAAPSPCPSNCGDTLLPLDWLNASTMTLSPGRAAALATAAINGLNCDCGSA